MNRQKHPPAKRSMLNNVSLFTDDDDPSVKSDQLLISKISLPSEQPRRYFDVKKMDQLCQSIKKHGILENLIVRPSPKRADRYELIAGERRYRAAKKVGLKEVPVKILTIDDEQALQIALVENLQREDLNPVEETESILQLLSIHLDKPIPETVSLLHRMLDEVKGKVPHNVMGNNVVEAVEELFTGLGRMGWKSFVVNRLPLLKLPSEILEALRGGKLAYTKAIAISRVKDEQARSNVLHESIEKNLSLSEIKAIINGLKSSANKKVPKTVQKFYDRVSIVTTRLKKSQAWTDKNKRKQAELLLKELESLAE
ncbi:ParB/RepB/Spo0J family partition protein [Acaryochloris marina]|uniref:ParB/RepB/Spo0J family partition protein n=1 Tax=Acaryochloris marina TaxID=155978 RepID=UPI001BAE9E1A|nr:ParB/RepB/Spo0J family partition protein [Acaryochloris marina]QUY45518.1 ParB/RepB/Spo0J family partition protein [Acaryochloris marina S15]